MFTAMVSRSPVGGLKQRYQEVVDAVASTLCSYWDQFHQFMAKPGKDTDLFHEDVDDPFLNVYRRDIPNAIQTWREKAENLLTQYPLHPKVQWFFDTFVGQYGHSSPMELTGSPTIGVEGVSWFTAWLLFDSPLVAGQEFSTRAVRRVDWPMAQEASGNPVLHKLHEEWLTVYEAEVAWWTNHLSDASNRAALGIADKEPFRPALDRARWALPGTFATGAAFASHLRERARVIRDAAALNKSAPTPVWADIEKAYRFAVPGLAGYGLREAVVGVERDLPGHLENILFPVPHVNHASGVELDIRTMDWGDDEPPVSPYKRKNKRSYADPWFNRSVRVRLNIECSIAAARDWHRHRTLYPWHMGVVCENNTLQLDRRYGPKSDIAVERTADLLARAYTAYADFKSQGDVERAALALPMGTRVVMSGAGGLRDVLYALELRAHAHGANFEYKEQAEAALYMLDVRSRMAWVPGLVDEPTVWEAVGALAHGQK